MCYAGSWVVLRSVILVLGMGGFSGCTQVPVRPAADATSVYKIVFQNRAIGRLTQEEFRQGQVTRLVETLEIKTQFRGMRANTTRIIETHEASADGLIARFSKDYQVPSAKRRVRAEIHNNIATLQDTRGELEQISKPVPNNFLSQVSLHQKMKTMLTIGAQLSFSRWDENTLFAQVQLAVVDFDANRRAWKITEHYPNASAKKPAEYWVDENFSALDSQFTLLGQVFSLARCFDECRQERLTAWHPLDFQLLPSPYVISEAALNGHIRYQLDTLSNATIPNTCEQVAKKIGSFWQVDVRRSCSGKNVQTPEDFSVYLRESTWLEINNAQLIAAVSNHIKPSDADFVKMQKLTAYTRKRLGAHLQFQGYATALQAFKSRSGDCTEYALLLAALGRVAQVPTRVVMGYAYSRAGFHGKTNRFAPHAWVQAWVNGAWQSFDAGLKEFNAGHIVLKISDGSQQDFMAMVQQFSDLKIKSAQHVVPKRSAP